MPTLDRRTRNIATVTGLSVLLISTIGLLSGNRISNAQASDPSLGREKVRQAALQRLGGIAHGLTVPEGTIVSLPLSGRQIVRYKVRGPSGLALKGLDLDQATQAFVDVDTLITDELVELRQRREKRTKALDDSIRGMDPAAMVEVSLAVHPTAGKEGSFKSPISSAGNTPKVTRAQGDMLRRANVEAWEARLRGPRNRISSELNKLGIKVTEALDGSSAVFAKVPVGLLPQLGKLAEVEEIDAVSIGGENELNVVADTLNYDPEIHTNLGFRGEGTTVGIVEIESGRVAAHTNLLNVVTPSSGTIQSHATSVAGIVKSNDATRPGYAPNAALRHDGSSTESTRRTIFNSHVTNGALPISASYAAGDATSRSPNAEDKFFDEKFTISWVLPIKSAGNRGAATCTAGTDGHTTHPGLGYNTLTVGGFNDGNSVNRAGDTMYNCSSFTDPSSANGDREKPEVVAPAQSVTSTNTSNGFSASNGTSLAAPGVAGVAALMLQAEPGLNVWPEIMKAIVMATSTFNIEGDAVLSDKDGVGAIDPRAAVQVAQGDNGGWNGSGYMSCSSTYPHAVSMPLQAGRRTRVVAIWHQDVAYSQYASRPNADLDLEIITPLGGLAAVGNRNDDTFEVVEFTPPTSGNYSASVIKWRCDTDPKYIGVVWYQVP